MQSKSVNEVVEEVRHDDGVYEIKVHAFSGNEMGMYEDGMRKAIKEMDEKATAFMLLDFSGIQDLKDLDDRTLFDMFQFISFNCMRHGEVRIRWGQCLFDYLKKYSAQKHETWKLSSSTIKKFIDANCESDG